MSYSNPPSREVTPPPPHAAQQYLAEVAAACHAVHAPATAPATRARAGAFLEAFKARPDAAPRALELFFATGAGSAGATALRHFALHALETSFKKQWYTWDRPTVDRIKGALVEIARSRLGDILAEPLAIREKTVTLLVEAAKREWPQRWPNFLDLVLSLCRAGYTQADVGVRVLRRLAEDGTCPDFNTGLPAKRRHEILSALNSTCGQFLTVLLQLLSAQYAQWTASQRQNRRAILLVDCVLDALEYLCEWLPLEVIYNPPQPAADMRQIFATLLQEPHGPTRRLAARCLRSCVARHKVHTPAVAPHVRPMVRIVNDAVAKLGVGRGTLLSVLSEAGPGTAADGGGGGGAGGGCGVAQGVLAARDDLDESAYTFQKDLAALLGTMGVNLLAKMDDVVTGGPELEHYLRMALSLFAHPSIAISSEIISAWSQLLERCPHVLGSPQCRAVMPTLLQVLTIKLRKWGSPHENDRSGVVGSFSVMDYDDHEGFQIASGKIRGRVTSLLRCLARADPGLALQHLGRTLHALFVGPHRTPGDMLRRASSRSIAPTSGVGGGAGSVGGPGGAQDCATMWSTSFVLFEAAATLTDAVVVNVKEKNVLKTGDSPEKRGAHETAALAKPMHDIAHMWFGFQTQDPLLLAQQLAALTSFAFAGYYRSDLQLLGSVLEKLFASLTFVPPAEAAVMAAAQAAAAAANPTPLGNISNGNGPGGSGTAEKIGQVRLLQMLHADTRSTRRRAATSLIRLGQTMPDLMYSNLPGLVGRASALVKQQLLLPNEQSLLFEMLTLVSNSMQDLPKQRAFLDDVLATSMAFWTSPGVAGAFADGSAFVRAVRGTDRQGRWRVQTTLTTFTCVAKRTRAQPAAAGGQGGSVMSHPFVHKWPAILPSLFAVVRAVHACWRPELRAAVEHDPDLRWLLRISPLELMSIVGYEDHFESNHGSSASPTAAGASSSSFSSSSSSSSSPTSSSPPSSRASAANINNFNSARDTDVELATQMQHTRCRAYDLISIAAIHSASVQDSGGAGSGGGRASSETTRTPYFLQNPTTWTPGRGGLFDVPNVVSMIQQSLLSDLPSMEHRHFRSLLTAFFKPYCQSCPLPLFASHIRPVFVALFEHGAKRCSEAWAGWNIGDQSKRIVNLCHMPLGVPASSTELIQAKIIRDVSRELLGVLSDLIPTRPAFRDRNGRIVKKSQRKSKSSGGTATAASDAAYVSPLAKLLLGDTISQGGTAETVLRVLSMAAAWPDSQSLGTVVKVVERILPVVAVAPQYFPYVGGSLLLALVRALFSESPSSKENQHGLIHVIALIYCGVTLGMRPVEQGGGGVPQPGPRPPGSDVAARVFASLPGSSAQACASLHAALAAQKSTKQRRMTVQDFLQTCAQRGKEAVNAGHVAEGNLDSVLEKKMLSVLNLPEPVHDHRKRAEAARKVFEEARWKGAADGAVASMFSS